MPNIESEYALRGTIIHAMLEAKGLNNSYNFKAHLGEELEGGIIEEDHVASATECWRALNEVFKEYGVTEYEPECTTSVPNTDDIGGTLDMIAAGKNRSLLIDYKAGEGILVDPYKNSQLLFATWSGLLQSAAKDILEAHDEFTGVIIQPSDRAPTVKTWDFTIADVIEFEKVYVRAVAKSRKPDAKLKAGSWCRFCPAHATCPEKTGMILRARLLDLDELAQLAEGLSMVADIKLWINAVESAAYNQLEAGAELDGWKRVKKRPVKVWKSEAEAKKLLTKPLGLKALTKTKFITPAQAEDALRKKQVKLDVEPYYKKISSGYTIAKESDKRKAVLSVDAMRAALNSIV